MRNKQAKLMRKSAKRYGGGETQYEEIKYPRVVGYHKDEDGNDDKKKPIVVNRVTRVVSKESARRTYRLFKKAFRRMNHNQKAELSALMVSS